MKQINNQYLLLLIMKSITDTLSSTKKIRKESIYGILRNIFKASPLAGNSRTPDLSKILNHQ